MCIQYINIYIGGIDGREGKGREGKGKGGEGRKGTVRDISILVRLNTVENRDRPFRLRPTAPPGGNFNMTLFSLC